MITDPERIAALHRLNLLDTPPDPAFDRLTRLAARILKTPIALVTLVDSRYQFFKSQTGLAEAWASQRETPLSYTFCQHVVNTQQPVIIEDARRRPRAYDDIEIAALNVIAYAGVPLITDKEHAVGAFCVIDHQPRRWTDEDIATLIDIAGAVMTEIHLCAAEDARHRAERQLLDVTEQHVYEIEALNEQLAELERVKTDMIRVAAHDLRNPLGLVMGYSELMLEESDLLAEHHREFVTSILRSGQKMLTLIKDILSLERVTAAQHENHQQLTFSELAREVYEANREAAQKARLAYTFTTEEKPLITSGDEAQLREAIENLISNAIKYTPAGGKVAVQVWRQGDHILFQVEDTGYGIPEEDQARLFQPFYRVHTDETYKIGGTGLGLHLVKNIIDRHAGQVVFKSVYKQGSTFGFYLPKV
jgi:signal transduction histidine kinase